MSIHGIFPALLTLFDEDDEINYPAMEKHIDFLIAKGVQGLFLLGTTGEGMLLSQKRRKEIAEYVITITNRRIPVIVHVSDQTTAKTVELARHAEKIGAFGISSITPYFFPVDNDTVYSHFSNIASAVSNDFPIYIYNNPNNAGNEVAINNLKKLIANHSNIKGLKYSPDHFKKIIQITEEVPDDFPVMLGVEQYFYAGLCIGAAGGISDIANIYPEPFVKIYHFVQEGNLEEAKQMQKIINKISKLLHGNISYFKSALAYRGFPYSKVHDPLREITTEEQEVLYSEIEKIDHLFR